MRKLSVLIFSRNDADKAIDLIKDVYSVADDIVLVDSSDEKQRAELLSEKRRLRLLKLRIFYAVALGYPDPLRMYGLKKCRNDWVLYLDTDERISDALKRDVKTIINETALSAFAIGRYDYHTGETKPKPFLTWNIRLYNKGKIQYRGMIHEQPLVSGKLGRLDTKKYFIRHMPKLRNIMTGIEYDRIERFERLSYRDLNEMMVDYLSKAMMTEKRSAEGTLRGKLLKGGLIASQKIRFKKPEDEVSLLDYFAAHSLLELVYLIKRNGMKDLPIRLRSELERTKRFKAYKTSLESKEDFEISKIISRIGIIKFLGLDKERAVAALNKEYKNEKQGITLLIKLLKDKYRSQHKPKQS